MDNSGYGHGLTKSSPTATWTAPSPWTRRASSGPTWASGCCRSRVRPTTTASWTPGSGSASTRKAPGTPAAATSRPPRGARPCRPGSSGRTCCLTRARVRTRELSWCTWETVGSAWSRAGRPKITPTTGACECWTWPPLWSLIKYKEGELRTAKHRAYGSMSYHIPHQCFDPARNAVAFWM